MMRRALRVLATAACLAGSAGAAGRQSTAPSAAGTAAVDIESLGPKVGDALPAFTLPDQRGQPRSLGSLLGPKGAVIVFFRSADW